VNGWHLVAGPRRRRTAPEAGNAALEAVILSPVLVLLICLVIAAGRLSSAQGSVDAAARDAARQASIMRSPQAAHDAGVMNATADLAGDHLKCAPKHINVDITQFGNPLGLPANVSATVQCTVSLAGLVLPGLPGGNETLTYTFSSPLDPYRGRT
jgi:Flp pilus assembly protein TadG